MIKPPRSSRGDLDRRIGAKISVERVSRSLSLETVATFLKVSEADLTSIEAGSTSLKPETILLLCDLFDVLPSWFFPEQCSGS